MVSNLGRGPGSLSFMRSQGRVIKAKECLDIWGPNAKRIKNLKLVRIEPRIILLVKGSVPGKSGSMVFIKKK